MVDVLWQMVRAKPSPMEDLKVLRRYYLGMYSLQVHSITSIKQRRLAEAMSRHTQSGEAQLLFTVAGQKYLVLCNVNGLRFLTVARTAVCLSCQKRVILCSIRELGATCRTSVGHSVFE